MGTSGQHDEICDAGGSPVVEVVECHCVALVLVLNGVWKEGGFWGNYEFVKPDVRVVEGGKEIFASDSLAPVSSCSTFHSCGEPERHVIVVISSPWTGAVVVVLAIGVQC